MFAGTIALWLASGVTLATGLIRGKISAVYLGPAGMGLIAQLNYLASFAASFAAIGLSNGCIKLLAEARALGDTVAERRVRSIALLLPTAVGVAIAGIVAGAGRWLAPLLLGSSSHQAAIAFAALSVPFSLAAGGFSIALQGRGDMRRVAGANAINAAATTVVVVAAVAIFGLQGAIAAVMLTSVATLVVYLVREPDILRGASWRRELLFERATLRAIYAFASVSVVLSALSTTNDLAMRSIVVHQLGIHANGLYQPVVILSTQFFLAMVAALATYLFPRLSGLYAAGDERGATAEVNAGLRIMLFVIVPGVIAVAVLAPTVLRLAFSSAFVGANGPLVIQMAGDIFRALGWTFGAVLLPLGLLKVWFWLGTSTLIVQLVATIVLLGPFGLSGVSVAYTLAWAFNAVVAVGLARRRARFRLERTTALCVIAAVTTGIVVAAAGTGPRLVLQLCATAALVVWIGLAVRCGLFGWLRAWRVS